MKPREEIESNLGYFYGTEQYWRYSGGGPYTDGVKYIAESCEAFWLLDAIYSAQTLRRVKRQEFQHWVLKREGGGNKASLTCDNGNSNVVYRQLIEYTDFPLESIEFYLTDSVLMLKTEY